MFFCGVIVGKFTLRNKCRQHFYRNGINKQKAKHTIRTDDGRLILFDLGIFLTSNIFTITLFFLLFPPLYLSFNPRRFDFRIFILNKMYSIGSSSSHTSGASTSRASAPQANRRVATGVLGVMRRAEERKRKQQLASTTAADYMLRHNMPETIDRILGQILSSRPSDPLAMLEELLRQCDSDGSRKFGSSNGYVSEPTSRQGNDAQPSGAAGGHSTSAQVKGAPIDLSEGGRSKVEPSIATAEVEVVQAGSRPPPAPEDTTDTDYYSIPNDDVDVDDDNDGNDGH